MKNIQKLLTPSGNRLSKNTSNLKKQKLRVKLFYTLYNQPELALDDTNHWHFGARNHVLSLWHKIVWSYFIILFKVIKVFKLEDEITWIHCVCNYAKILFFKVIKNLKVYVSKFLNSNLGLDR